MPFGAVLKELQRSSKGSPSINGSVSGVPAADGNHQPISRSEALRNAASAGDFDRVKELCKKSVAIDADGEGRTALHYASLNGHLQIVKEIINAGAKVNVKDAVSDDAAQSSPATVHLVSLQLSPAVASLSLSLHQHLRHSLIRRSCPRLRSSCPAFWLRLRSFPLLPALCSDR